MPNNPTICILWSSFSLQLLCDSEFSTWAAGLIFIFFGINGPRLKLIPGADFLVSAAVAEFKGPSIYGVVRLAQVNMELARIEANFSGLPPGKHGWSINQFGDLTKGAASTGKVFNPSKDEKEVGIISLVRALNII